MPNVSEIEAYHSIDAEKELSAVLVFEMMRPDYELYKKEGLFKKFLESIFEKYEASELREEDMKDFDSIIKRFIEKNNLDGDGISMNHNGYLNFKKEIILKRIGK